ncbi:unnamed protein product, partial [Rotaria sordida]
MASEQRDTTSIMVSD